MFEQALATCLPQVPVARRGVYVDAYLGVVDSLNVELIYAGPQAYARRLRAMWVVFGDALNAAG
ncbi:hypothetical protein D3C77_762090 [compost metagenome]